LNTKKSYLDEVKATAKKHGLALSAIHPDVGVLPGEDKVLSMLTMFEIAQNWVFQSLPFVPAASPMTKKR